MDLLAEQNQQATDIGVWLLALAAIMGVIGTGIAIAVGVKKLLEGKKSEEQFVTRAELASVRSAVENCITRIEFQEIKNTLGLFASKSEVSEVKQMIMRDSEYMHERFHKIADVLQPLPNQVALLGRMHEKLADKLDQHSARSERILAVIESSLPRGKQPNHKGTTEEP